MNKQNILKILVIVCVVLVAGMAGMLFFSKSNTKTQAPIKEVVDDAKDIKDLNKEAIDKAGEEAVKPVRKIDNKDHYKGKLDAPIQLIVYSDFECPFCFKFVDVIKKIEETYGDKVVVAFRHFPLRSHTDAIPAAIASECANEQGKFWEMHDLLFQNAKNGSLTIESYKENAKTLSLDQSKFDKCLADEKYRTAIMDSETEAKEFGVGGTPASFVNGEPIPGAVPFDDFKDSSDRQREGMKTIIDRHLAK